MPSPLTPFPPDTKWSDLWKHSRVDIERRKSSIWYLSWKASNSIHITICTSLNTIIHSLLHYIIVSCWLASLTGYSLVFCLCDNHFSRSTFSILFLCYNNYKAERLICLQTEIFNFSDIIRGDREKKKLTLTKSLWGPWCFTYFTHQNLTST